MRQRRKDLVESRPRASRNDGRILDERRLERGAVHGGIDAGAEDVAVDGPGAAEHEARDRGSAEEVLRKRSTGRFPAAVNRRS